MLALSMTKSTLFAHVTDYNVIKKLYSVSNISVTGNYLLLVLESSIYVKKNINDKS